MVRRARAGGPDAWAAAEFVFPSPMAPADAGAGAYAAPSFLPGRPVLAGLTDPLEIFVKPAGSSSENYAPVRQRSTLPHFNPNWNASNSFGSMMYWNWIGNQLRITPVNVNVDIELTGRFSVPPLVNGDMLVPGGEDLWIPLVYDTAAVAGIERSNPQILAGYQQRADRAKDNLLADIIRQGQGAPARFQRTSRDSGNGYISWFWGL